MNHRLIQILDSKASAREKDANGFLIIRNNPIAKAGVFEYLESEILPDSKSNKIVKVYRPFDRLESAKETFANKPIKFSHAWVGNTEPQADGAIGSNITADGESLMLKADLIIYNPKLIEAIENGECVELSPAYTGDIKEAHGRFNGSDYDFIQNVECVNHLAVVENGRSGKDLRILDSKQKIKEANMPKADFKSKLMAHLGKFFDSADGGEPKDEPKTADSKDELIRAILEIAKSEGDDSDKIAKIGELLGTQDEDGTDEPKDEPKTQDSDEPKGDDEPTKTQDDGESDNAEAIAEVVAEVVKGEVEKEVAKFADSFKKEMLKVQDSYENVRSALGVDFDKKGMSADDIYKFGYETLSGVALAKGENAETAFNVIAKSKKVAFKDSAPVASDSKDSTILKMLESM